VAPESQGGERRGSVPLDARTLTRLARRSGRLALERRAGGATPPMEVREEIEDWIGSEIARSAGSAGLTVFGSRDGDTISPAGWKLAVDAIDDPLAYEAGHPTWSVALALLREGRPISAVVFVPALNDLYVATGGRMRWQGRALASAGVPMPGLLLGAGELQRRSILGLGRRRPHGATSTSYPICLVARGAAEAAIVGPASLRELAPGLALLEATGGELLSMPRGRPLDTADLARGRTRTPVLAAAAGTGQAVLRRLRR